jgi:hypothetical protein
MKGNKEKNITMVKRMRKIEQERKENGDYKENNSTSFLPEL